MINPIHLVLLFIGADISLTILSLYRLRKLTAQFYKFELNPIFSYLFRRLSFVNAIIASLIFMCIPAVIIIRVVLRNPIFLFVMMGMYFVVILIHFHSSKMIDKMFAYRIALKEMKIDIIGAS